MQRRICSRTLFSISQTVLLACLCATSAVAAAAQATPAPPPPEQPAAQSPAPPEAPASDPSNSAPPPNTKKVKKVWTNEEVSGMSSTISVVGDGRSAKSKNAPQKPADPQYISSTKTKLQKLHEQIAAADKELATLKDFSEGEPVSTADREFHKSYNNQPIAQQIASLQTKKLDLQSQIDALLDEARQKGVEPGQLR
jgi:hypothetical protein